MKVGRCKCNFNVRVVLTQGFADPHRRFVGEVSETLTNNVLICHCGQSVDTGSHCAETNKQQELISCFRITNV